MDMYLDMSPVEKLRATLTESVPYCSGTLPVKHRDHLLGANLGRVHPSVTAHPLITHMSALQANRPLSRPRKRSGGIEQGVSAGEFRTPDDKDSDIFDETYRKAGKLDIEEFMIGFDADHAGLVETVRMSLFPGHEETRTIEAQLYKLNVYGAMSHACTRHCF